VAENYNKKLWVIEFEMDENNNFILINNKTIEINFTNNI
jgi:hypothetical protein